MPLPALVIGAGQAGLGTSYYLKTRGIEHVVLERGRIGETWRTQRWDSFAVNTPNAFNTLPGDTYDGPEPDGFYLRDELVASYQAYAERFELPVRTGVTVTSVAPASADGGFTVRASADGADEVFAADHVVVASGIMQTPRLPIPAGDVPQEITQLTTATYRNAGSLPPGAVVVVGGAQSGAQITEDLLAAGRTVYLCTSKVARARRRYRGRDLLEWWVETGMINDTVADLEDPAQQYAPNPLISGVGRYGHSISLQQLQRDGVRLLGRFRGIADHTLLLADTLAESVAFGDERSAMLRKKVDEYIASAGVEAPPAEDDAADEPVPDPSAFASPERLDLRAADVRTIIWCTGFTADFSWIEFPVVDGKGRPVHANGITAVPGLYFVGFPWLRTRKSGIIAGVADDAGFIVDDIARRVTRDPKP